MELNSISNDIAVVVGGARLRALYLKLLILRVVGGDSDFSM